MRPAHRRPDLELPAQPRRRRVALVEHGHEAGRADHDVGEVARLHIADGIEFPRTAPDHAQAGVLPLDAAVRTVEPQRAFIAIGQPANLQFDILRQGRDPADLRGPAVECGARAERGAIAFGRGEEALPAVPAARGDHEAAPQTGAHAARQFGFAAVVDERLSGEAIQRVDPGAFQLDRTRQRACAERPRSAAPRDADLRKPLGRDRAERDIAEEGIAHRYTVEQHQCPTCGIAAQRAQRGPLRRGIGRTAVRPAELLEPGDRGQRVLDPARGNREQLVAVDYLRIVSGRGGGRIETRTGDDDHLVPICVLRGRGFDKGQREGCTGHQIFQNRHRRVP